MQTMRNSLTNYLPTANIVTGTLSVSGGTPTLSQLSGTAVDGESVSVTDNGTGDFTISVKNFRGMNGSLKGFGTCTTISNMVSCTAQSYTASTNTANFTFKVEDDASTAVDNGFNFILLAD